MSSTALTQKVNFRFSEGLRKRLESLAKQMGVTEADVVRTAVESYDPKQISVLPAEADAIAIQSVCAEIGCSPNFILRLALKDYLRKLRQDGLKVELIAFPQAEDSDSPQKFGYAIPTTAELDEDIEAWGRLTKEQQEALLVLQNSPIRVKKIPHPTLKGVAEDYADRPFVKAAADKPVTYGPKKTLKPKKK